MSDVFISHVKEDSEIALEIARGLEEAGYTTWYYERDSVAGVSYLLTTKRAIEESFSVLVIISSDSLGAPQMTKEVVRGHESNKPFIPILRGITHDEFQQRQPEWREAMGAAASLEIPPAGIAAIVPRIVDGLEALGIHPKTPEERAAEVRTRERAQRLEAILRRADQCTAAGDWDKAVAALDEYLSIAPEHAAIQSRLLEAQQRQRQSRLTALRAQAANSTQAERWDQALAAWRAYLAMNPGDKEAAQVELQKVDKLRAMAQSYAEAEAALAKKDYDRAVALLKALVMQDETYKQASRLLARAIESRHKGGQPGLGRWIPLGLAGVLVIAVVLTRVLPTLLRGEGRATPSPAALPISARAPTVASTPLPSAVAKASPTRSPTVRPVTPSSTLRPSPTLTPRPPQASPTASPEGAATVIARSVLVPEAVVGQFFSPGPDPKALAVAGDTLWVWDDDQRLLYQLDRTGDPLAAFPITFTNTVLDLDWDGAALRLTLANGPHNPLVVRLDSAGSVLQSFVQPLPWDSMRVHSPTDGTMWEITGSGSDNFVLQFDADGRLVQSFGISVLGWPQELSWSADGLWVVDVHGYWYRWGLDGELLSKTQPGIGSFPYKPDDLAFDELGYLWVIFEGDRRIYQVSLREKTVTRPTPQPATSAKLPLPKPRIEQATTAPDKAIVHVTNSLAGTMTLSFCGQWAILYPNDTWSAEAREGACSISAGIRAPEQIAFSGKEYVVPGYEYTWVLRRPEDLWLEPTAVPKKGSERALPAPEIKTGTVADKVLVHLTNHLEGTMTLSFGEQAAIVKANDTWSAELEQGTYRVFASANAPEPIAFSGDEMVVAGYEYTWVLQR